jgi:hypothetical protein
MKTYKPLALIAVAILLIAVKLIAVVPPFSSVTLAWDRAPSHGTNTSVILRWGPTPGSTNFFFNAGTNTTATITNMTAGYLYWTAVARTSDGLESDPSNMVVSTNYPGAPLQLKITTNTSTSIKLEGTSDGHTWNTLAIITNDPVLLSMRRNMMFRASTNQPPLPR